VDGELICIIPNRQNLYCIIQDIEKPLAHVVSITKVNIMDLHCCMGHIAHHTTQELITKGLVTGLKIVTSDEPEECKACIKAKLTCWEIPKVCQGKGTTKFGQEIWSDLWGPPGVATLGGHKYFISFTDEHSCWTTVYLLQTKDILKAYKAFEAWVKKHLELHAYIPIVGGGVHVNRAYCIC
jgi:GAG-pre-integrase domain